MPALERISSLDDLARQVALGESETLEFKSNTGLLQAGCQTLCGMLNGRGGRVLFGVSDKGRIVGQTTTEATLREVSQALRRLDPPYEPAIDTVLLGNGNAVIVLTCAASDKVPHTYDGRPWQRLGSTTSVMP